MSRIVIDASAAAALLLPDEAASVALEELLDAGLDAPWLFWAELRNILIVSERRGRLSPGAAETFLDAIDGLNGAILDAARERWPDAWATLAPRPVTLGSWVGCDTDGRTDIGWWDTVRYRLESKRTAFGRILATLPDDGPTGGFFQDRKALPW